MQAVEFDSTLELYPLFGLAGMMSKSDTGRDLIDVRLEKILDTNGILTCCSGGVDMDRDAKIERINCIIGQNEELCHWMVVRKYDIEPGRCYSDLSDFLKEQWGLRDMPRMFVDVQKASKIVNFICSKDLAYHQPLLMFNQAQEVSELVCSLLSDEGKYLTNATFSEEPFKVNGWSPCTESTFDTGVLCFDESFVFMIWVAAED